jgi:alkanesulfonate monooxygenase SsuD/methylene tetrahydromethanopterin reductase-like flavin-dependent oxidoreductase (luciferase family)
MRVYKVEAGVHLVLAGTQADARAKRDELVAKYDFKKKDVAIAEHELPTGKSDLLAAINELLTRHEEA